MAFTHIADGGASIAVDDTGDNADLGAQGQQVIVSNVGSKLCYIHLGSSTVTATTSALCLPSGQTFVLSRSPDTQPYIAAICDSGETTTLKACAGHGIS